MAEDRGDAHGADRPRATSGIRHRSSKPRHPSPVGTGHRRASDRILSPLRHGDAAHSWQRGVQADLLIASYNVHKCIGVDKRFDPERTAAVIGEIDADVIALQEADRRFGGRAGLLDLQQLERENGLIPVPAARGANGHGWHGNLLLFRRGTLRDVHRIRLPGVEPRGALVVDVDLTAGPLRIVATHLGLLRRSRGHQADAIVEAVYARHDRPTILLGDLNEWPRGQRSALHNLGSAFGPLAVALPSFPSRFPLFALDRILANPYDLISGVEVHSTLLARVASDHLPIKARIALNGTAAAVRPAAELPLGLAVG